jgi:uncharacterized membrane-anchored protein
MKRILLATAIIISATLTAQSEPASTALPAYSGFDEDGKTFLNGLDIKKGEIALDNGISVKIADGYYFLDKEDANEVLVNAWGNPPSDATLGMIFPIKYAPISDGGWGIELSFDAMGHVDDSDAASIDYDELLAEMQADTQADNEFRVKDGYEPITLVGWASPPKYDFTNKRLHWAKELKFGTKETNTLNYNVRVLGREGVLVMNYISDMRSLPEISASIDGVMNMVSFQSGKTYADFQPGVDTVAAVGIGGLVAGKVLAKTGLLAVALVFLKKFGFLLLLPVVWLFNRFRRGRGTPSA